jgi:predicted O-methyltransferase YrrM
VEDFELDDIKEIIEQALKEELTGDTWYDSRYREQVHYVGHTQPYYLAFYLIAKALKPKFTVELGTWQATASASLAFGHPGGQVITIDIHKDGDDKAVERTLEAVGHLPNLTYINKWTWDAVEDIKAVKKPIDILYIDAWHDYQYVSRERELYFPLLADTALVIADDILPDDPSIGYGMQRFWKEISEGRSAFLDTRPHPGVPMGFLKFERELKKSGVERNRTAGRKKPASSGSRTRKSTTKRTG